MIETEQYLTHERIKKIIAVGYFGGEVSEDQWYVHYDFGHVRISLRPEANSLEFWITNTTAHAPVTMPLPLTMNAQVSGTMRWIFGKLIEEFVRPA